MTSTPNELTSRLRRRLEAEHREIEETAASELRRLGASLSAVDRSEAPEGCMLGHLARLSRSATYKTGVEVLSSRQLR